MDKNNICAKREIGAGLSIAYRQGRCSLVTKSTNILIGFFDNKSVKTMNTKYE